MSEEQIQKRKKFARRNLRLKEDKNLGGACIIWSANDPNEYQFNLAKSEDDPEDMVTICQYFDRRYGIRLEHPDMPCIHIGQGMCVMYHTLFDV